jgi:hypothetical protein
MTSKTGWTRENVARDSIVCQDELLPNLDSKNPRRVTVAVFDCPERMARAELRKRIGRGMWVRQYDNTRADLVAIVIGDKFWWVHEGDCEDLYEAEVENVTHAREHQSCPWTEIVEEDQR